MGALTRLRGFFVRQRSPSRSTVFAQSPIQTITLKSTTDKPYLTTFSRDRTELELKRACWQVYAAGGPAAQAIDIRVTTAFTNGWKIDGDYPQLNSDVESRLEEIKWEQHARMAVRDAYVCRWGLHEIAETLDGESWTLVTRPSCDFVHDEDVKGNILGYRQFPARILTQPIQLPTDKAIQITPIPTSYGDGISLIERARDQIDIHKMVSQASADSIWRHGYPKWDIQITDAEGKQVPADIISSLEGVTTDLNPRSEMVMNTLSKIAELDKGGIPQVNDFGEWALTELAVAMGVPEEAFGLGHRSTEATAKVKRDIYYDMVAADQFIIASQYQDRLLDDLILPDLKAKPGDARLAFENPNPDNQFTKAQYLQTVVGINPMNAEWLLSRDEQLGVLGIKKPMAQLNGGEQEQGVRQYARHISIPR